jgi:hypothetical protein
VVVGEEVILDIILEILVDLLEEVVFVVMVVHHPLLLSHQQLELHSQELLEQLHLLDGVIKVVLEVETLQIVKVAEEAVLAVLVLLVLIVLLTMVKVVLVYKCQQHLEILLKIMEHLVQQVLQHQMDMIPLVNIGLLVEVLVLMDLTHQYLEEQEVEVHFLLVYLLKMELILQVVEVPVVDLLVD